jgi:beta-N-acetylhexosaminidase
LLTKLLAPIAAALLLVAQPAGAATLEEMAGQMIIVGFGGDSVGDAGVEAAKSAIAAGIIGGVMYLKSNVATLPAVERMNAAFAAAAPNLPPFITLDQEGGAVERLTEDVGFPEIPRASAVAADNDPQGAEVLYSAMAHGVADLGFTVNFGPVVDLDINPRNAIIARYGRSYGSDPRRVVDYAAAFIRAHRGAGLLTALKHFPGHGSSAGDSHEGFVDITRTWSPAELDPYRSLVAAGFDEFVMVGHLHHEQYSSADPDLPASLSADWIEGVLRHDIGFTGLVISDDLEMGALRQHYDLRQTVTMAVRAGMDVLLFSNTAQPRVSLGAEVRDILISEAEADPAFRARIEASYGRIVALKGRLAAPQ